MGDRLTRAVEQQAMARAAQLPLTFERGDGCTTITLEGELDTATVRTARSSLACLAGGRHSRLSLDLRGLTFIDSAGIGLLADVTKAAARAGWSLSIVKPRPDVFRVIELCGFVDGLPFVDEPTAAPPS
jgi:anti-anti-sigma factor